MRRRPNGELPKEYSLMQNYPRPFNPSTTTGDELPKSSMVKLGVYDMLGRDKTPSVGANDELAFLFPRALATRGKILVSGADGRHRMVVRSPGYGLRPG